ncbi:MAG TPA: hypothetical protein PK090_02930 [Smithellaceae bacterium]|nr:hypothetical protein [Smithellaceae bacterium]
MRKLRLRASEAADVFYLASLMLLYAFWLKNPEVMFFITCIYAVCFLKFVLKHHVARPLLIGLAIAFAYLTVFKEFYHYQAFTLHIFGYPLFPLLAWPLALTLMSYYARMLACVLKLERLWPKVFVAYGVYAIMLIVLEYTAYHYLNIRLASSYSSLPLIDCLHTPASLKVVYFINGFFFFTVYFYLNDLYSTRSVSGRHRSLRT